MSADFSRPGHGWHGTGHPCAKGIVATLVSLSSGKVGIVSTLSATSPVLILPMIWLRTGERPAAGVWLGAALVVAGMALLFVR